MILGLELVRLLCRSLWTQTCQMDRLKYGQKRLRPQSGNQVGGLQGGHQGSTSGNLKFSDGLGSFV